MYTTLTALVCAQAAGTERASTGQPGYRPKDVQLSSAVYAAAGSAAAAAAAAAAKASKEAATLPTASPTRGEASTEGGA